MKLKNFFIGIVVVFTFSAASLAKFDSKSVTFYNNGIDLTNQENYEEAVIAFEKAIKIEPEFVDAYYNLGVIQQYLGNQDKALESFQEILKYNPEDYEVLHKIAVIYHNEGNRDKALTYLKKIPEDDPNYGLISELIKTLEAEQIKLKALEEEKKATLARLEKAEEAEEVEVKEVKTYETYSGFDGPTGIARDSKGNLYVANYSNNSIVFISNKSGDKEVLVKDGPINGPLGLAVDKNDNLYVANYESNQIVVLPASDRTPQVLPFIVKKPYFLMVDTSGVLYVSEQGSNAVSCHNIDME